MTDLAQLAENNLIARLRIHAEASGGSVHESDTFVACTAPVDVRAFNQVIIKRLDTSIEDELRDVLARYEGRKTRITALEDVIGDNEQLLLDAGLTAQGGIPSLALTDVHIAPSSAAVTIREVTNQRALSDHVRIVAAAFDFDPEVLATVFSPTILKDDSWHAYVGYVNDEPVATTQLVVAHNTAGLYYVGTLEEHRGRGYGDAVTRHAVIQGGALGCDMASLQASPAGYPVYRKMGFDDVGYYRSYVPAH